MVYLGVTRGSCLSTSELPFIGRYPGIDTADHKVEQRRGRNIHRLWHCNALNVLIKRQPGDSPRKTKQTSNARESVRERGVLPRYALY